MDHLEMEQIAENLAANLAIEDIGEFVGIVTATMGLRHSEEDMKVIYDMFYQAGVDIMTAVCKKHPS
jgi:hypothetical protein